MGVCCRHRDRSSIERKFFTKVENQDRQAYVPVEDDQGGPIGAHLRRGHASGRSY
jgi:hypothetical protein